MIPDLRLCYMARNALVHVKARACGVWSGGGKQLLRPFRVVKSGWLSISVALASAIDSAIVIHDRRDIRHVSRELSSSNWLVPRRFIE